jgi:hypothetical protein
MRKPETHSYLHDDELLALAIPSDGQYITSARLDKKIMCGALRQC